MSNFNRVLLMGRLTRDIELKQITGGQSVANIGLAINRKFKTKASESREEVTFVDCEVWGRTAEVMAEHLAKGSPIFVEGRLKLDQWDADGQTRSKLKVVIERFEFVGDRSSKETSPSRATSANRRVPIESDIPF